MIPGLPFATLTGRNLRLADRFIMVAEKAADAIRGRAPLAPSNAAVYIAPDWQTKQR